MTNAIHAEQVEQGDNAFLINAVRGFDLKLGGVMSITKFRAMYPTKKSNSNYVKTKESIRGPEK